MCIGVPAKVLNVDQHSQSATVGDETQQRVVSLMMLDDSVQVGDYLLIQVGNFAIEKLTEEDALKALELQRALAQGDFERAAELY